jgi:ABC-type multidrug transport system fused ATPase/permease subunit
MNIIFISKVWRKLPFRERAFVGITLVIRLGLVTLDLLGIFLVGSVVSLLSGTKISNSSAFGQVLDLFSGLGFKNSYAGVLFVALVFFIAKGVLSAWLISRTGRYLGGLEARTSGAVFESLIEANLETVEAKTSQDLIFSATDSVNSATSRAILTGSTIISEGALLLAVSIYLALADFWLFTTMCLFFGLVGVFMNRFVSFAAARAAKQMHIANLVSKTLVQETLENFRQVAVSPNRYSLPKLFQSERNSYAQANASFQTINGLPRYITEIAVLLGVSLLVLQRGFSGIDGTTAPVISMFLVGIFRIVSSMLPLQSALSGWKHLKYEAIGALDLLDTKTAQNIAPKTVAVSAGSPLGVEIEELDYSYPLQAKSVLQNLNLSIKPGEFVALTGPSGSGKSTLADCILGLRENSRGSVFIEGAPSRDFIKQNPGRISYVPQDTPIFTASIRANVSLNFGVPTENEVARVETALLLAGLPEFSTKGTVSLESMLGEGQVNLSGGQAQRIGIARALYTKPGLLVLDEATSALDAETQDRVQETISLLRGRVTLIVIAHRQETIANADRVINLK